ncbi:flagellar biosynthetic protein FliO [Litchfieldia salsa]|uniref:Flagellar protein FliO/FliZ n=1 Tax=Litchfieldia salsa TaxID=930152 RepID=A0A1H0R6J7_9BACI|nr:flagellar biosynthetic protein FliO [Litchfieldia salsa]SDP25117.1 flagellar protein FliO/FliZ [Litchfieldia salsa]
MYLLNKVVLFLLFFTLVFTTVGHAEGDLNKNVSDLFDDKEKQSENNQDTKTPTTPEDNVTEVDPLTEGPKVTAWDFFKMIIALLFVISLLYFFLKLVNKRNKLFSKQKYMENLGGTSLGTNRSLQLIKVGNQVLVVGVGESITLLKEISQEDEVDDIVREFNNQDQIIQPMNLLKKITDKRSGQDSNIENDKFALLLKEQLSDLSSHRKKIMQQFEKKGTNKE